MYENYETICYIELIHTVLRITSLPEDPSSNVGKTFIYDEADTYSSAYECCLFLVVLLGRSVLSSGWSGLLGWDHLLGWSLRLGWTFRLGWNLRLGLSLLGWSRHLRCVTPL